MTNRPMISGVLSIISGAFGIIFGLGMAAFFVLIFRTIPQTPTRGAPPPAEIFKAMEIIYSVFGIGFALVGVLAITGGVSAIKKKQWGLALAGAIAGSITFYPTGIVGVIFACLAKQEFATPVPAAPVLETITVNAPGADRPPEAQT